MTKPIQHKTFKAEFGAGIYFIGDPCYALKEELYEKWGTENNYDDGDYGYFAVGSTKYGDGTYYDNFYRAYGVDAGILGVVNMEYSEPDKYDVDLLNELGRLVRVKDKLIFEYNHETCTFIYSYDGTNLDILTDEIEEDGEDIENEW